MALLDFQMGLGRMLRAPEKAGFPADLSLTDPEQAALSRVRESRGFRFTTEVQRSWCRARAAKAARLTLAILPPEERLRLLEDWVGRGGGTASFFAAEADRFLEFIAGELREPSHELALCRFEQAALRASEGVLDFTSSGRPSNGGTGSLIRRGRYAALVRLYAEPHLLMAAFDGQQPFPPLSNDAFLLMFAPGLDGLWREAAKAEAALWNRLVQPISREALLAEGVPGRLLDSLAADGFLEYLD